MLVKPELVEEIERINKVYDVLPYPAKYISDHSDREFEELTVALESIGLVDEVELLKLVRKSDVDYFWHCTATENYCSIRVNGLYPRKTLEAFDASFSCVSNEVSFFQDSVKGLSNYVRLAYSDNHPFKDVADSRVGNSYWLKVNALVIATTEVKFCPTNAASNYAHTYTLKPNNYYQFAFLRDQSIRQCNNFSGDNAYKQPFTQGEVLIKSHVSLGLLMSENDFPIEPVR